MDNNLYLEKFNNYISQSVTEIVTTSDQYYKTLYQNQYESDLDPENDEKEELSKKLYINSITMSIKKLLNNTESIFSHSKFELINNCINNNNKFENFNSKNILDLIGSIKSDYNNNSDDDEQELGITETSNIFYKDYEDLDNNENSNDEASDTEKEEESIEEVEDDNNNVQEYGGCIARKKRKYKYKVDSSVPDYFFRDSSGYTYGFQCGNEMYKDNLCESHYKKSVEKGKIELVNEFPSKYENNKVDQSDTESESLNKSQLNYNINSKEKLTPELSTTKIKNKNYLVDKNTDILYDYTTKEEIGKRVKSNKKNRKYDYLFND